MSHSAFNLKQLASHLGLSQTTVSRALNGFPEVNEKTRTRVVAAARQYRYRPSQSATSLATGKARVIGHVVQVSHYRMINPHFSDFLSGASDGYSAADYDLMIRTASPGEEEDIYRDFTNRNRVDGVVVHGPKVDEPRITLLNEIGLPFVVHGRSDNAQQPYSWFDVNNRHALKTLTDHVLKLGHERIGFANGLEKMNFARRRRLGYEEALAEHGIDPDPTLVTNADMTEPYGYQATLQMLDMEKAPTAIIYSSILSAMGGIRALHEKNLRPGVDISMATYDDRLSFLESGEDPAPPPYFTSARSSLYNAGRLTSQMLLDQISGRTSGPVHQLWSTDFVVGRTTSPPR